MFNAKSDDEISDNLDSDLENYLYMIADGDTEAVGDVYELTKTQVYGYILSILKNPTEAEDAMQDVYVKICTCAGMYHSEGKPMAWIFTIARNVSLMRIRKQSRISDIPEFEWEQLSGFAGSDREDRIVLEAALLKISDEESQIVMLHAVGGMKHREIAELFDMPLATVLSKYNRALKKLQKILED